MVNLFLPKSLRTAKAQLLGLLEKHLWAKIIFSLFFGLIVGALLGPDLALIDRKNSEHIAGWIALPGYLFLALIQMVVVPLVFSSIVRGLAGSKTIEHLKRLGLRLAVYFIITTSIAVTLGIISAYLLQPGKYIRSQVQQTTKQKSNVTQKQNAEGGSFSTSVKTQPLHDRISSLIPINPLQSMVTGQMLHVVIFSIIFGIALLTIAASKSKPLLDLLESLLTVCLTIVNWSMKLAPLAVFGLVAKLTASLGINILGGMGIYVLSVVLGLIAMVIVYLIIILLFNKTSPKSFLAKVRHVQLLAFSTSSSAAVMPLSIETAEKELKVKSSVSQVIIPLGTTINMDGTALYQGVATVFLAQAFGVELSLMALLFVITTAIGASIGSPATPGVGIIILASILEGVGIPASGIALIVGVDRVLDMCRTTVNVTGDLTASIVMNKVIK